MIKSNHIFTTYRAKSSNELNNIIGGRENISKRTLKKWHIILISVGILLIGGAIFIGIILSRPPNTPDNPYITREEAKKALIEANKPIFKVISKKNTLNQLLMKCSEKKISISNGVQTSYYSFTKAIFDIYTLDDSPSSDTHKEFYYTKYTTIITINSQCQTFSKNGIDCTLQKYLDLNKKNTRNLEEKDEEVQKFIKEAVWPICLIEHTETNLIISVSCPETLSFNIKNYIISAFQIIKPTSIKGLNEDESVFNTTIEAKGDKIYINSINKVCEEDYDLDLL